MNNTKYWKPFIGACLLLAACGQPQKDMADKNKQVPPPTIAVEEFFKNPEKSGYDISPNGEYISFLAPHEERMNLHVQKRGSDEVKRITSVTDRDLGGYYWANDDILLYVKDNGGDENFKIYATNRDGSSDRCLTDFPDVVCSIIDPLEDDPEHIIFSMNKRIPQVFDPYRLNIVTGEMKMIAENPGNITGWQTDHDGKLRLATSTDGVSTSLLFRETEDKPFKVTMTTDFKESASPLFFTFDNKNVYAASNIGRDKSAIVVMDPRTGKELEKLYEHPEVDVDELYRSRKRKVLTSANYNTDKRHRHFFDDQTKTMVEDLESKLPGYEIGITANNKNEDIYMIRTYSDRSRGAYYMYDLNSKELDKISEVSPWLKEDVMAEMKPISYTSSDGLKINGYLTLPVGREHKDLPVVVNPHGGPWHRDTWGYNPEVQMLANRGYAVLQVNFRGSTGYGRKFWESSFKQWGKKMQDDVTEGVNWLVERGIADKDRIAIYGASYGGYCTLAGLAFTPDVYACGVDYVGVSNLFSFQATIPPYWEPFKAMLYEMVGDPVADSLILAAGSPALHAAKIKAPLFIAQGANDPRVKKSESDQMVEALKAQGVTVEYMVKDNEGHGFHNEENRFEFYNAMDKFLEQHIGKAKVAVEA